MSEMEVQMERMRSPEIRKRIEEGWDSVIFACGAVEQHGPHLPLFMDAEHGTRVAVEVALRLGHTLVAPTVRIGCSEHHMAFSGTISLRNETFEAIVTDYVTSLSRHGFRRIMIMPTHGGNFAPLTEMAGRLQAAAGDAAVHIYADLMALMAIWQDESEAELGLGSHIGGHADLGETAIMLSLHPELVRMDLAAAGFHAGISPEIVERIIREGFDSVTPNGILGDARGATPELGVRLVRALADVAVSYFEAQ